MAKNSQQNLAQDMVRGKKRCEQVFQNAMSKGPYEQKQKVIGEQWGLQISCINMYMYRYKINCGQWVNGSRSALIMLKNLPIMLCCTAPEKYLLCSTIITTWACSTRSLRSLYTDKKCLSETFCMQLAS